MKTNENRIRFDPLSVHKNPQINEDHAKTPWIHTSRIEEKHGHAIYSCSFNQFIPEGQTPVLLTVADRFAHLYECPLNSNALNPIGAYQCSSETEMLYASTWCYDTYEKDTPFHFAVAGNNGLIYIVEATTQHLVNTLSSHGGPINEMRTNPQNPNVIASASKDKTVRVFHIRNSACIFVLAGHETHADQILSLDWSFCGKQLVSCGMDHTIFLWNLGNEKLSSTLDKVCNDLLSGKRNCLKVSRQDFMVVARGDDTSSNDKTTKTNEDTKDAKDGVDVLNEVAEFANSLDDENSDEVYIPVYFPCGQNADLHGDYVDCVRFFNNSKYILSKGCGKESVIYMSRFGSKQNKNEKLANNHIERSSVKMTMKYVPNGETWFIKFDVDPMNKWLACGNNSGDVHFWKFSTLHYMDPDFTVNVGNVPIRQVAFGGKGRILIAVTDNGTVSRLDRVSSQVVSIPQFKMSLNAHASSRNAKQSNVQAKPSTSSKVEQKIEQSSKNSDKLRVYTDMSCEFSDDE